MEPWPEGSQVHSGDARTKGRLVSDWPGTEALAPHLSQPGHWTEQHLPGGGLPRGNGISEALSVVSTHRDKTRAAH